MSRYFHITAGLRGCYMPDDAHTIRVDTRRELKEYLAETADHQACDGRFNGLSKRNVAWAANRAWQTYGLPLMKAGACLPFGEGKARPFAIEVSPATRAEWLEYEKESR